MPQLKCDPLKNFVQLYVCRRVERFTARDRRQFVQKGLTLHPERISDIVAVHYTDSVGNDVRFLHRPPDLIKIVTRRVVLTVTNYQQSSFLMCAVRYTVDAEVYRIIQSSISLWLDQRKLSKNGVTVACTIE